MSLKDKGWRFTVAPDRKSAKWTHYLDVPMFAADWTDCTNMSGEQFYAFMRGDV